MKRLRGGVIAAAVMTVAVTACTNEDTKGASGPEGEGAALAVAEALPVKGRAPKTGYARERFGTAWADTDSNSCDTRVISMVRAVMGLFSQRMQGVIGCA
ncbi:hypothetical protein QFZ74_002579 [Streptomyces sp. V3I7]|nr:hypothetical protein [Streptomyces sp. V3I7]